MCLLGPWPRAMAQAKARASSQALAWGWLAPRAGHIMPIDGYVYGVNFYLS